ncbi:NDP-sugar synthase [Bacteroidota bacterium]
MKAIILAGGKGTRLKPFTTNFPKPLMPVGDKPILEILLMSLKKAGIKDIIITTGHLSEMIRLFFEDGSKFGLNISYSIEDKPLGTAGPIKLQLNNLNEHFLLMNGDVLTDLNFSEFIEFHQNNKNDVTIGSVFREQYIDFGIVELDNDKNYTGWNEKPTLTYLVSMGMYLFSPDILEHLPESDFFTAPELISVLEKKGKKIMGYTHKGYWLDIGRPEDYEKACNDFTSNKTYKK